MNFSYGKQNAPTRQGFPELPRPSPVYARRWQAVAVVRLFPPQSANPNRPCGKMCVKSLVWPIDTPATSGLTAEVKQQNEPFQFELRD